MAATHRYSAPLHCHTVPHCRQERRRKDAAAAAVAAAAAAGVSGHYGPSSSGNTTTSAAIHYDYGNSSSSSAAKAGTVNGSVPGPGDTGGLKRGSSGISLIKGAVKGVEIASSSDGSNAELPTAAEVTLLFIYF
jgi:hypothetical protein